MSSFTTPTLFPTPSPPETSDSSSDNNNAPTGILGSTGGAPLILVFLGAGLLVGAIFALLILRRFYPRRRLGAAALGFGGEDDRRSQEKPLLCDVKLDFQSADEGAAGDAKWDIMQPMSVRFIPDEKIPPPSPLPLMTLDSADSGSDTPRRSTRFSGIRRHLHLGRTSPPDSIADNDSVSSFESPTGGYSRNRALQVTVAIEMPRQPSEKYARQGRNSASEREFCLGLTEIPWNERAVAKMAEL